MPISVDRNKLTADLTLEEGNKNFPYTDTVGKLSIGVGRNLTDTGISDDEISVLLSNDIDGVIRDLGVHLPWLADHPEPVQRAVADMCFNMGIRTLLTFVNALATLKARQYDAAADEFLKSKWAQQVPRRAQKVTNLIRSCVTS